MVLARVLVRARILLQVLPALSAWSLLLDLFLRVQARLRPVVALAPGFLVLVLTTAALLLAQRCSGGGGLSGDGSGGSVGIRSREDRS